MRIIPWPPLKKTKQTKQLGQFKIGLTTEQGGGFNLPKRKVRGSARGFCPAKYNPMAPLIHPAMHQIPLCLEELG